jgi:hypothetical protein
LRKASQQLQLPLFGVAWNATGIGLIAAAIAAIVIGLIALYIKFESVRNSC